MSRLEPNTISDEFKNTRHRSWFLMIAPMMLCNSPLEKKRTRRGTSWNMAEKSIKERILYLTQDDPSPTAYMLTFLRAVLTTKAICHFQRISQARSPCVRCRRTKYIYMWSFVHFVGSACRYYTCCIYLSFHRAESASVQESNRLPL